MMKTSNLILLLVGLIPAVIVSCKKDKPVVQEPVPDVIYSAWTEAKNFRDTVVDNSKVKAADLLAPEITQDVLNKGAIQVFLDFGGGVYPLPHTSWAGNKESVVNFLPRTKKLIITRFTTDNSGSVLLSTLLKYRYVIVLKKETVAAAKAGVNMHNYEMVKSYFRLPD